METLQGKLQENDYLVESKNNRLSDGQILDPKLKFWSHLSAFWRFQLTGWLAFVIVTFPLKLVLTGSAAEAIYLCLVRDGSSFLLTLALRNLYRAYWSDKELQMATLILVACSVCGMLQNGLFFLLRESVPLGSEIFLNQSMVVSEVYERTGLLFGWSFLYYGMRHALESKQHQLELTLAKSARQEAEIQMLRAQMNPHLLSNAMQHIQAEVEQQFPKMGAMVQSLMNYLNYSLRHQQDDFITLGEEYDALMDFLKLEELLFGSKLDIGCQMDPSLRVVRVPGVILQPLVENAVKYGLQTRHPPICIRLEIRREESFLVIQICNTGHWVEPDPNRISGGIGLTNLRRRLSQVYGRKYRLETGEEEGWVTVRVFLPIKL